MDDSAIVDLDDDGIEDDEADEDAEYLDDDQIAAQFPFLSSDLSKHPIHASISALDHEAMEILTMPPSTPSSAHHEFAEYLQRTRNTICGRHPIGVLLGALSSLQHQGYGPVLQWVRYEQSSQCYNINDSSVSYASAYIQF